MTDRMKLHWSPKSPYVRKVMVCAQELGVLPRLELVRSVAAMASPNPSIMHDNPLNKIPTLVRADGSTLFDSRVICEYLNDQASGNLFPVQGEEKWQTLRWHALGDGLLDALILWRNERERDNPLPALIDAFEVKTRAGLQVLEAEVNALHIAPFSIAHISVGCMLGYIDYRFAKLEWRATAPKLSAWFAELSERPSFHSTAPVDG